jgi:heme/copper-type cytochrome/quinol oxidase subunit 1
MLALALPVLVGIVILLYADHRYGRVVFGGNLEVGEWIDWALNPVQLFAYAVIALGVVADIATTVAATRSRFRGVLTGAIGLAAIFGFGAELITTFRPTVREELVYVVCTIVTAVLTLVVLAAIAATIAKGRKRVTGGLVFAVAGLLMILVGAIAGALTGFSSLDLVGDTYASDTVYNLGVFNYIVLGVVLIGIGALAHWGPKLWGRMLPEAAVMGLGVLGLIGVVLTAFPDLVSGFLDQPLYAVEFDVDGPTGLLNGVSTAGYVVVLLVVVAFAIVALRGFLRGAEAGDDPWDGSTVEWATSSPPPPDNFALYPVVGSPEPLFDVKEA